MIEKLLPVDIVLSPEWWNKNAGITFDRDFFFHPLKRVESEQQMEKILFEKWGGYGLGGDRNQVRPEIGAVHLAAGFLLSGMLGCEIRYSENHPPQVIPAHREDLSLAVDNPFKSDDFRDFLNLTGKLKEKYGYLSGDVNWGGILNIALDLRGESLLTDLLINPEESGEFLWKISRVIDRFVHGVKSETGTSSISVNRNVRHFREPVFLHSECSHTMISTEDYEDLLLDFDMEWSRQNRPFGIHYCGSDPHRFAESFAKIPHLDFLDVGWGGDVKTLRKYLPDTFFNLRLSPVEIRNQTPEEIDRTIKRLVSDSGNPFLTGICCINMDDSVEDEKIETIFKSVEDIKSDLSVG
jgi:hypothetical protein